MCLQTITTPVCPVCGWNGTASEGDPILCQAALYPDDPSLNEACPGLWTYHETAVALNCPCGMSGSWDAPYESEQQELPTPGSSDAPYESEQQALPMPGSLEAPYEAEQQEFPVGQNEANTEENQSEWSGNDEDVFEDCQEYIEGQNEESAEGQERQDVEEGEKAERPGGLEGQAADSNEKDQD